MSGPPTPSLSFLQSDAEDPPVTVVREIRVRAGSEAAFEEGMSRLIAEATGQPGHLGATVIRPDARVPGDPHRFIYKFDRRSNLERWHRSPRRAELFAPLEQLIESDRFDDYTGLETWFELPGPSSPQRWKSTLMTWAAIYVLVLGVSYVLQALHFDAPLPVRALVLTGIVVPLVGFVVAPWLGRVLHGWLHAHPAPASPRRVRGSG